MLLEKDPLKRASMEDLISHPFLENIPVELKKAKFPWQPQFDQYLWSRGIDVDHYHMHWKNSMVSLIDTQVANLPVHQSNVDILRLSHNVKRNMNKDEYCDSNDV